MQTVSARLTRRSGTNFYYAFRVLPVEKREALFAFYSFCRTVDDCVDEQGGEGEAGLTRWLSEVDRCYQGRPETELGQDLARALAMFPIPRRCFEQIVEGCRMDLSTARYRTFAELRAYCERVASAVGLGSIEIFGYRNPGTRNYAVALGLALQLTNILRDIAPDAARGRIYLPQEDLERFGVADADLREGAPATASRSALLAFQAERAREFYRQASGLLPEEDRRSMLPAEVMAAIYRALLEELGRQGYPVGGRRLRLSTARKVWVALKTVLRGRSA
jgi:phytoene synthase